MNARHRINRQKQYRLYTFILMAGFLAVALLMVMAIVGFVLLQNAADESAYDAVITPLPQATSTGQSQTTDGVTVTLTQVSVDAGLVVIGFTVDGLQLPDGNIRGAFAEPSLFYADGRPFGTGGSGGGVTPLDKNSSPAQFRVTFVHSEPPPADNRYDLLFRLRIGGTIWALPDDYVSAPGPLPDAYRHDIPQTGLFEFPLSVPVSEPVVLQLNRTVESAGITMTLQSVQITPSQTRLNICFDMPDSRDWEPHVLITLNGESGLLTEFGLAEKPESIQTERCLHMNYLLPYQTGQMMITVDRLQTSIPEVTPEIVARAQERLRQQGITVEFGTGENGFSYNIIKSIQGIPDEAVHNAVVDALRDFYEGQWVFSVDVP